MAGDAQGSSQGQGAGTQALPEVLVFGDGGGWVRDKLASGYNPDTSLHD